MSKSNVKRDGREYKLVKTNKTNRCEGCPFKQKGNESLRNWYDLPVCSFEGNECPKNGYDLPVCSFEGNDTLRKGVHCFKETILSKIRSWLRLPKKSSLVRPSRKAMIG